MEFGKKFLATVSCVPNQQACYVRLKVSRPCANLPLNIKAHFAMFDREQLVEGTIVKVMRSSELDHTKYALTDILENTGEEEPGEPSGPLDQRVKFHLPPRYFTRSRTDNGMHIDTCRRVLKSAFGLPNQDGYACWQAVMMAKGNGFNIVCTAEQFARFIILRHEEGQCINGIRDLRPELHMGSPWIPTLYDTMEDKFGLCRDTIEKVLKFVDVPNRKMGSRDYIDVTGLPDDQDMFTNRHNWVQS